MTNFDQLTFILLSGISVVLGFHIYITTNIYELFLVVPLMIGSIWFLILEPISKWNYLRQSMEKVD